MGDNAMNVSILKVISPVQSFRRNTLAQAYARAEAGYSPEPFSISALPALMTKGLLAATVPTKAVESSPHPGSGECAEDFNNSLTSKETAMKTVISTSKAPAAIGPYSQAIRKGDTLYLSGQIGMVPATGELVSDDVKEQTAQALANMKAILAEAGATPADVTKVTVFIVDMAEFQIVNGVYSETFGADAPARSCVAVAALPKGARVEIEAIAVL